jgi:hypothetical protein
MRIARHRQVDPTWLLVTAIAILALAALTSVLVIRSAQAPADLSTPSGVVTAYVRAVQAGKADEAWALLSPDAVQAGPGEPGQPGQSGPLFSRSDFQQQVEASRRSTASRVRIIGATQSAGTATVQVEVTNTSGDLLTGVSSQTIAVSLRKEDAGWRITSNLYPGQLQ